MAISYTPLSQQQESDLRKALEYLRNANSQSNTKGNALKAWFLANTGHQVAVSFITEARQIGNRFKEQKGKIAPYTVFFFEDESLIDRTKDRIGEYIYPELRAVFFFYFDKTHQLRLMLVRGDGDTVAEQLKASFGNAGTVVDKLPSDAMRNLDPQLGAKVPGDNPCGLVGVEDAMQQAMASIAAGKHVLLLGPPGTAKTEMAECLCQIFNAAYRLTTATAEWTTFETIGGYLTSLTAGSTELDFHLGMVTESIMTNRWLIIDEFNRADMDKAFGELFTILLGKTIDLPFQKRTDDGPKVVQVGPEAKGDDRYAIKLSPSWRLVATMNSFDKSSLARLSLALMRRFSIIHIQPPQAEKYSALLKKDAASRRPTSSTSLASFDAAVTYLDILFASNAPVSFRAAGIEIGPAIPLDSIKYISQRLQQDEKGDPRKLVLEAVTNYLFPQFEGRDDLHQTVMDTVTKVIGVEDAERKLASERLGIFTGYKPPR